MMTSLQQELLTAQCKSFFDLLLVFLQRGDVRFGMSRSAVEIAEFTIGDAYIGCIRVAVYNPSDNIAWHLLLSEGITHIGQFGR